MCCFGNLPNPVGILINLCTQCVNSICSSFVWPLLLVGIGLPAAFAAMAIVTLIFSIFFALPGYTCQALRWTRAADQLPTMLGVYASYLAYTYGKLHADRQALLMPTGLLSLLYAPPIFFATITFVGPG